MKHETKIFNGLAACLRIAVHAYTGNETTTYNILANQLLTADSMHKEAAINRRKYWITNS